MKKLRVLMVPSDMQGVGHWRNIWPAQEMERNFKDKIEVEINHFPNLNDIEYLKQFDIIHFHRHLGDKASEDETFKKIRELGIKLVMDVDDYWQPFFQHPLYQIIQQEKISEKIIDTLKKADYI